MTVRIYRSTDPGAPTRSGLTGTAVNKLRQILRSCLVDGYGSKPGAGWSVLDEGSNGFSITNGNGSGIINFYQASLADYYAAITIYLLETMTGSAGGKLAGDNIRSGPWFSGSANANRHVIWPASIPLGYGQPTTYWTVIADENTCIFVLNAGLATGGQSRVSDLFLYLGEIDSPLVGPARFVVSGGTNAVTEGSNLGWDGGYCAFGQGNTALRDLAGGTIPSGASNFTCIELAASGITYPNLPTTSLYGGQITTARAKVYTGPAAGQGHVGYFRGIVLDPSLAGFEYKTAMSALGLPRSEESVGQFVGPVGASLAIFTTRDAPSFFATDNPAYW